MAQVKYLSTFFAVALIFSIPAFSQYQTNYSSLTDSETMAKFKQEVGYISAAVMEGRAPGSQGELETAEYVWEKLNDYGVEMLCPSTGDPFGITLENGDTLTSRNVVGFIQGYDKELKKRYIVIGARMDNLGVNPMTIDGKPYEQIYYGANGNASGLAVMMELARMLRTNSILLRRSVIFVAFGSSTMSYAGAWYFLNRSFGDADKIDVMINLDMLGTADTGLYAYTASNSDLNVLLKTLEGELQPIRPQITAEEPYPSDHRAFYSNEIPSVFLTSGKYPEHNSPKDTGSIIDYEMMERSLEYAYNLSMLLANTTKPMDFRPSTATAKHESYDDVVSMNDCDIRPIFLNSQDPAQFLEKWVYQYLRYPQTAVNEGVQGRVIVDFIIEKDGKISNVRIARSVDARLDEEAIRVVEASPKWKPGRVNGRVVRTSMTSPIEFKLVRSEDRKKFGIKK